MEKIFEEFAKRIKTTEEVAFFLDEISFLQKIIFKERKVPLIERSRGKISQEFWKLIENLEKENLMPKDPEGQFLFFEKFKEYLKNLPKMKIEIAFLASDQFLKRVTDYLEENFGQKIILDLTFNPKIVAGAIIEFSGKYLDFSLAKEIEKIFQKNKHSQHSPVGK